MVLERADLAIDGDDLMRELGLAEGPTLGRILDELLERAIADPAVNEPGTLLALADGMLGRRVIELLLAADRLLAAGDLDRAERIFRQVAEADPRNAIAVVGLARVADARGAWDQADALAGRALAIDPDDLAAQRLGRRKRRVGCQQAEPEEPSPVAKPRPTGPPTEWSARRSQSGRGAG